jgi:hypothetical protein
VDCENRECRFASTSPPDSINESAAEPGTGWRVDVGAAQSTKEQNDEISAYLKKRYPKIFKLDPEQEAQFTSSVETEGGETIQYKSTLRFRMSKATEKIKISTDWKFDDLVHPSETSAAQFNESWEVLMRQYAKVEEAWMERVQKDLALYSLSPLKLNAPSGPQWDKLRAQCKEEPPVSVVIRKAEVFDPVRGQFNSVVTDQPYPIPYERIRP